MSFALSLFALTLSLPLLFLIYLGSRWRGRFATPSVAAADVPSFKPLKSSWRVKLSTLPSRLLWLALFSFFAAFIDPRFYLEKSKSSQGHEEEPKVFSTSTEGIAIYLLLDQSGSMAEEVPIYSFSGGSRKMTKIDLLKKVTKQFIKGDLSLGLAGRPNDLIGLISFARGAQVMAPLTLDHQTILDQLSHFQAVKSRDNDGTAIGYAIFKAANLIAATRHYSQELVEKGEPAYTIKNSVIILITDGLQDPNPLDNGKRLRNIDIPGAAAYAKEQGVRLYIINVEPKMTTDALAPNRHQMERAAALTGGRLFIVSGASNLEDIYQSIDQLEKSKLPVAAESIVDKDDRPDIYLRFSLYPYFIALGLGSLFLAVLLGSLFLRRVP